MADLIDRQAAIDALHTWFRDGFDEDKWWNSTHVLAAIEGLPSAQQGYKWETCFDCPLSHGCPKIKGCTNEQAIEYASQIPNDCPLSVQPDHVADIGKKASISCGHENDLISRQEALKELAVYIHLIDKTMGKGTLTDDDCMEAAKSVLGEDELPAVQPDHNADIGKKADGDCISRQAVVKFFNDWISCLDENCHHQSVADMIIIKNDFKNLPSVQPESKWIPVSERLPDEGQKCLVSDKGAIGIDTYIGHGNPYNWKWYTRDYEAWMPLPDSYDGGDSK